MNTPICDFVKKYSDSEPTRMHMPGHKGEALLGIEHLDITEICGADSLYEANGIIAESESNASTLFGCRTLYSTEGSSQCIRAMLYLILLYAKRNGKKPIIACGRNAHKTLITAAGLLDIDIDWIYSEKNVGYLSCELTPDGIDTYLKNAPEKPIAVYLTSPDYLGSIADIRGISEVCHRHGVLLAVDNAHGAYLRFLPESLFPIDLGADICCDSAHKTLPVLTGGAYLHLSAEFNLSVGEQAKNALAIFGSTSPSYLILQSLDAANCVLEGLPSRLAELIPEIEAFKKRITALGFSLYGNEPLKITIDAKSRGYTGDQLAECLRQKNVEAEFSDPDHLTLMLSTDAEALIRLEKALSGIQNKVPISAEPPIFSVPKRVMTVRDAMLSDSEMLPIEKCLGHVLAVPTVGCPPAVPILVCGEEIDEHAIDCFKYYGITSCCVVRNK
ncbi:MAG: PLP-dependent transferase [Clostridia bacterium]|nr:PLP-dependent transferase [Clostridia bacterium]